MSTDNPTDAMMYNSQAYDDFLTEAAKDGRIGKHKLIVTKVVNDTWPSGDSRLKIQFSQLDAGNAKADLTWSPPPAADSAELAALKTSQAKEDQGKKKAIANAINIARQAAQHYSKAVTDFREGDVVYGECVKTKVDKQTGEGGFIRVVALLAPESANGSAPASGGPGF